MRTQHIKKRCSRECRLCGGGMKLFNDGNWHCPNDPKWQHKFPNKIKEDKMKINIEKIEPFVDDGREIYDLHLSVQVSKAVYFKILNASKNQQFEVEVK